MFVMFAARLSAARKANPPRGGGAKPTGLFYGVSRATEQKEGKGALSCSLANQGAAAVPSHQGRTYNGAPDQEAYGALRDTYYARLAALNLWDPEEVTYALTHTSSKGKP
jgi:hypothetical protein